MMSDKMAGSVASFNFNNLDDVPTQTGFNELIPKDKYFNEKTRASERSVCDKRFHNPVVRI